MRSDRYYILKIILTHCHGCLDRISCQMVCSGSQPRSGQTKHYKIGICFFDAKHTALITSKRKDRFALNQDNVVPITTKIKLTVHTGHHHHHFTDIVGKLFIWRYTHPFINVVFSWSYIPVHDHQNKPCVR